ncbi:glycosyl transferase family 1 [Beijerinckia sp. L45]|uniref:O-linked N-acetylglucosamine transferase, SPINDLY family protein n=1 Tax=Beijerinckia sp. L45 TaxID=1641855 RepID=UPI00131EA09B|nr:glycosyl transferase family 1 [Beijerinckia sp. L45]
MPQSAVRPLRSVPEEAAALQSFLDERKEDAFVGPDAFLVETLRRFNASDIIAVVDTIAYPVGSPLNIYLYKLWIELWIGKSEGIYAIWYNIAIQYGAYGDTTNKIIAYKNALSEKPDLYQAALNLGLTYEAAGETDKALALWAKSLQPDEARIALLNNRGRLLENVKKLGEAEQEFTTSLLTNPLQADVLHHWVGLRTKTCTWPIYGTAVPGVTYPAMVAATRALTMLALFDDIAIQDRGNASWIAEKIPPAAVRLSPVRGYAHAKLRIGYISSDFCMHPIAYLVAELFEQHDRDRFEIYGYCSTKDDGSAVRKRVLAAFDSYVDVRTLSDEQIAHRIRADEIDILVDLNGLTLGTRLGALRWKPAPVQMTYLGYNGPIPLPELDYIIADGFTIPPEKVASYRPTPLIMPKCYQVNDSKLPIAMQQTRANAGLPDDRFVFCSFSNTYKLTETVFDGWMSILQRVENSVLWLFIDNDYALKNVKARALRAGIAEDRLIFAGRVEASEYRGRLALADLFLDTYPYNAGTTASDALRVGLPLITLSGESFTSRMAGSLLTAMGLDEGIVYDQAAYVELAVALATDPVRYKAFRDRVTPELWLRTLGDTPEFCRDLEEAFQAVALRDGAADAMHLEFLEAV